MLDASQEGMGVEVIEVSEGGFVVCHEAFGCIFPWGKSKFSELMCGNANECVWRDILMRKSLHLMKRVDAGNVGKFGCKHREGEVLHEKLR